MSATVQLILAGALSLGVGVSLGLLGGGGSILTIPILVYLLGIEPKVAAAAGLVVVGTTSLVGGFQHAINKRAHLDISLLFAATGIPASYLGGWFSRQIPSRVLLLLFASFMIVIALGMIWRKEYQVGQQQRSRILAVGALTGLITGILGIGGGFVIVPALVLLGGVPMDKAVGTSLFVITINCVGGILGRIGSVQIPWRLTLTFTAVAILGSFLGTYLSKRISTRLLKRVFAFFILSVAIWMVIDNLRPK